MERADSHEQAEFSRFKCLSLTRYGVTVEQGEKLDEKMAAASAEASRRTEAKLAGILQGLMDDMQDAQVRSEVQPSSAVSSSSPVSGGVSHGPKHTLRVSNASLTFPARLRPPWPFAVTVSVSPSPFRAGHGSPLLPFSSLSRRCPTCIQQLLSVIRKDSLLPLLGAGLLSSEPSCCLPSFCPSPAIWSWNARLQRLSASAPMSSTTFRSVGRGKPPWTRCLLSSSFPYRSLAQ